MPSLELPDLEYGMRDVGEEDEDVNKGAVVVGVESVPLTVSSMVSYIPHCISLDTDIPSDAGRPDFWAPPGKSVFIDGRRIPPSFQHFAPW